MKKIPYSAKRTKDPRTILLDEIGRLKIAILAGTKRNEDVSSIQKLLKEKQHLLEIMDKKK